MYSKYIPTHIFSNGITNKINEIIISGNIKTNTKISYKNLIFTSHVSNTIHNDQKLGFWLTCNYAHTEKQLIKKNIYLKIFNGYDTSSFYVISLSHNNDSQNIIKKETFGKEICKKDIDMLFNKLIVYEFIIEFIL